MEQLDINLLVQAKRRIAAGDGGSIAPIAPIDGAAPAANRMVKLSSKSLITKVVNEMRTFGGNPFKEKGLREQCLSKLQSTKRGSKVQLAQEVINAYKLKFGLKDLDINLLVQAKRRIDAGEGVPIQPLKTGQ